MVLQDLGSQITDALKKLSKAPQIDEAAIDAVLKDICGALLRSDVNVKVVQEIRTNLKKMALESTQMAGTNRLRTIERGVYDELVRLVSPSSEPYSPKRGRANVFMFVGLQGSGKTTSIAKFANYWARKGWKTAMVCCDTFRAGAFDQLKQNAIKLHVPYYGDLAEADPVKLAEAGTKSFREKGYEIILVDTSGRHRQESDLFEEMEQVREAVNPDEVIFVMDSTIGQAVADQATAFKESVPVGSVIITKLDGHAKGGGAISAVAATDAPITFIGTGEHFDNFERFDAPSFVGQLLGKGNIRGLVEKLKDNTDLFSEKGEEMRERMMKGQFTMRDLREQVVQIMKMGSLSQVAGMVPGLSQMMQGQDPEQSNKSLRLFLTLMDSMTNDELDGVFRSRAPDPAKPGKFIFEYEKTMSESRMRRIAKGAGVHVSMVHQLMAAFKQFEAMFSKIGKANKAQARGGRGRGARMDPSMMMKNPNLMKQQLQNAGMDPGMLDQMGGMSGLMDMMKNGPGADMLKSMGGMMGGMGGRGGGRRR
mmetsp:Transcript_15916/g.28334  ORF Transcript_15916/g.28334 Transcript_15916/m.28334 type:complete len:536 (-) Transcript_15916:187-1794(-)